MPYLACQTASSCLSKTERGCPTNLCGERPPSFLDADCGAGVGRITKNLLLKHFNEVDLLEPARHFLDAARVSLSTTTETASTSGKRAVNFYYQGAQVRKSQPAIAICILILHSVTSLALAADAASTLNH